MGQQFQALFTFRGSSGGVVVSAPHKRVREAFGSRFGEPASPYTSQNPNPNLQPKPSGAELAT